MIPTPDDSARRCVPQDASWRLLLMLGLERLGDPEDWSRMLLSAMVESRPECAEFRFLFPEMAKPSEVDPPAPLRLVGGVE